MTLRPYEAADSKEICSWVKDEKQLFQWSADRIGKWPLEGNELNENYKDRNPDFFIPLTALDEKEQPAGHLFILYPDETNKTLVRFGFVIVSLELRGKGNGRKMLELAIQICRRKNPRNPYNSGSLCQQPESPRLLRIRRLQRIQHKNRKHPRQRLGMRGYGIVYALSPRSFIEQSFINSGAKSRPFAQEIV